MAAFTKERSLASLGRKVGGFAKCVRRALGDFTAGQSPVVHHMSAADTALIACLRDTGFVGGSSPAVRVCELPRRRRKPL